jgi:hypothetical protein
VQVVPRAAGLQAGTTSRARVDSASQLAERVTQANVFSASRRAPRERFVLPGQESMAVAASLYDTGDSGPQLYGIVMVDGARRALLQVGDADSVPRLVGAGDRLQGYRVRTIDADRVELTSAAGSRIVRLSRRAPSDSSGMLP